MVKKPFSYGFTIVELLIVIVVIGILASVTIVTFGGIQSRAENTKTLSGVDQAAKAVQIYELNNGAYPLANSGQPISIACIAEINQPCGYVGGTVGATHADCENVGYAFGTAAFDTTIQSVVGRMPTVSSQTIACQGKSVKGAMYYYYNGIAYILYYLKGDVACATFGGASLEKRSTFNSTVTRCNLQFPA